MPRLSKKDEPAQRPPAVRALDQPSAPIARLLDLQHRAGNRSTARLLSRRSPARARDNAIPEGEGRAPDGAGAVQRRSGFEIEGKLQAFEETGEVIAFDRNAVDVDGAEMGKIRWLVKSKVRAGTPLFLRGSASEDENQQLVADGRAQAVRAALAEEAKAANLPLAAEVVAPELQAAKGNYEYRSLRRVEVLYDRPGAAPPPSDGRVHATSPAYQDYKVADGLQQAEAMLDRAIGIVGGLPDGPRPGDPDMELFRRFFTSAKPAEVVTKLRQARQQIAHYRVEAPLDVEAAGGGHACYDESRPGLQFVNQGVGAEARMFVGAETRSFGEAERAYNIVHEATHGAPGLETVDKAYGWQRLFPYLSPAEQLQNADSFGMLVALLSGATQTPADKALRDPNRAYDLLPPATSNVVTVGLDPAFEVPIRKSMAWLEYYVLQVWLNLRDLYPAVSGGLDLSSPVAYAAKLFRVFRESFGFPGSAQQPAAPVPAASGSTTGSSAGTPTSAGTAAAATATRELAPDVAGVIDRFVGLRDSVQDDRFAFVPSSAAAVPEAHRIVTAGLPTGDGPLMRWVLERFLELSPRIRPDLRPDYVAFIVATVNMSGWGGPLAL